MASPSFKIGDKVTTEIMKVSDPTEHAIIVDRYFHPADGVIYVIMWRFVRYGDVPAFGFLESELREWPGF